MEKRARALKFIVSMGVLTMTALTSLSSVFADKRVDDYVRMGLGMFIHFNMATFTDDEGAKGNYSEDRFNPSNVDCGQWADVAKAGNFSFAVLTTKHQDGFCLWDSKYTKHDVASSPWNKDIVRPFVDEFRKRGLKVGFYYCGWDLHHGPNISELHVNDYGGVRKPLDRETADFIKNQLTELLTEYGEVVCIWFDGYWYGYVTGNSEDYEKYIREFREHVRDIQPNCLFLANLGPQGYDNGYCDMVSCELEYGVGFPPTDNLNKPWETCSQAINNGWFWHPNGKPVCDAQEMVLNRILPVWERRGVHLLDFGPGRDGRIEEAHAEYAREIGRHWPLPSETIFNDTYSIPLTNSAGHKMQIGIEYQGAGWRYNPFRNCSYKNDVHFTDSDGDFVMYQFRGKGVEVIGTKPLKTTTVEVCIDGNSEGIIECKSSEAWDSVSQCLFKKTWPETGFHLIKIEKKSGTRLEIDALKIIR